MTLTNLHPNIPTRAFVQQLVGDLVIGLVFVAALRIPDSHTWQFALSVLVFAALAAAFLWLQTTTLQALREPASITAPRRYSYALLALWIVVWGVLIHLLQALFEQSKVSTRAGYWNSRLSPHLRQTLTFDRLSHWQHDVLEVLLWWVLPALLLPLIIESVARGVRALRSGATYRVARRPLLWIVTGAASLAAYWITCGLLSWHPGHSVHAELISLVCRIGVVYVLDIAIYLHAVGFIAQLLAREHAVGNATP